MNFYQLTMSDILLVERPAMDSDNGDVAFQILDQSNSQQVGNAQLNELENIVDQILNPLEGN